MRSGGNYVAIGNKLIMYNLDPMDTDRYTCVAKNFVGVKSATSTLKVHGMHLVHAVYSKVTGLGNFGKIGISC